MHMCIINHIQDAGQKLAARCAAERGARQGLQGVRLLRREGARHRQLDLHGLLAVPGG